MSQHVTYPVGIPTELPTLSHLGLTSIVNKDANFPSFSTPQRVETPDDLYTKSHESFPSAYPVYPGRTRLEETRFLNEPFKPMDLAENYFEDNSLKTVGPRQNPLRPLDSKPIYESPNSHLGETHPSRFGPYEREYPPASSIASRHFNYAEDTDVKVYDRYLYSEVEPRVHRPRIPTEHIEWEMPRRRPSHEGYSKLPTSYYSTNGYDHPSENEYTMAHEFRGYHPLMERDYRRRPDMYSLSHPSDNWSRVNGRPGRYSLPERAPRSLGLDTVIENCKTLHQFATDYGYSSFHTDKMRSLPPDHLLKQMTNHTYDILQVLMSLRSESLRTNPESEMEGGGSEEEEEEESSKLEDEDMKYIRDKRSLLSNSKSKYQKRTRNGSQPRRCHACNSTETPEWRRGPDGARTLCNACGLHYAKLNRKRTLAAAGISEDKDE
ncbi:hypothetical protein K7432_005036 [Basidiobolus ranarum]|uniref:GATA-type domain-containing protein n=1 Tax=Basidiobolus ranarum TaxID=34480 RepID=A0ABR2W3Q0_9FUNG